MIPGFEGRYGYFSLYCQTPEWFPGVLYPSCATMSSSKLSFREIWRRGHLSTIRLVAAFVPIAGVPILANCMSVAWSGRYALIVNSRRAMVSVGSKDRSTAGKNFMAGELHMYTWANHGKIMSLKQRRTKLVYTFQGFFLSACTGSCTYDFSRIGPVVHSRILPATERF